MRGVFFLYEVYFIASNNMYLSYSWKGHDGELLLVDFSSLDGYITK